MSETILLIGFPETGKTTFLAALWFLVDGHHNTQLTLDQLQIERGYLNSILGKWLTYEKLDPTRVGDGSILPMKLKNTKTEEIVELCIPDLLGETFRNQWLTRSWTSEFEELILNSSGALLFIHPSKIVEPIRIDQAEPYRSAIANSLNAPQEESTIPIAEWDSGISPTQVQIVELLQFVEQAHLPRVPYKIGIIISAWDLVKDLGLTPEEWLKKTLPLLYQYLGSKRETFHHRIYGVSAQGADYIYAERLASYINAADRIQVVDQDFEGHDITIPLVWLINKSEDDK